MVNHGVHYHDNPEEDQEFKDAVFPILDEMAEVGKTATVVWRYMGRGESTALLVAHTIQSPPSKIRSNGERGSRHSSRGFFFLLNLACCVLGGGFSSVRLTGLVVFVLSHAPSP